MRNKDMPWFDDHADVLLASTWKLISGGPVIALGLTGKSLSAVK